MWWWDKVLVLVSIVIISRVCNGYIQFQLLRNLNMNSWEHTQYTFIPTPARAKTQLGSDCRFKRIGLGLIIYTLDITGKVYTVKELYRNWNDLEIDQEQIKELFFLSSLYSISLPCYFPYSTYLPEFSPRLY